jgi:transposase-like protein
MAAAKHKPRAFKPEEKDRIATMKARGMTYAEISRVTGRNPEALRKLFSRQGASDGDLCQSAPIRRANERFLADADRIYGDCAF